MNFKFNEETIDYHFKDIKLQLNKEINYNYARVRFFILFLL